MTVSHVFKSQYHALFPEPRRLRLLVVGGGTMSKSLVDSFTSSGCFDKSEVYVCTKTSASASRWKGAEYANAYTTDTFYAKVHPEGIILLSVRLEHVDDVVRDMVKAKWLDSVKCHCTLRIFTIVEGLTTNSLKEKLQEVGYDGHVLCIHPNAAAAPQTGVLLVSACSKEAIRHRDGTFLAESLGNAFGSSLLIPEQAFAVACAASRSSAAFLRNITQAFSAAVEHPQLDADTADQLSILLTWSGMKNCIASGKGSSRLSDADFTLNETSSLVESRLRDEHARLGSRVVVNPLPKDPNT